MVDIPPGRVTLMHAEHREQQIRSKQEILADIGLEAFDEWLAEVLKNQPRWYQDLVAVTGAPPNASVSINYEGSVNGDHSQQSDSTQQRLQAVHQAVVDSFAGGWDAGFQQGLAEALKLYRTGALAVKNPTSRRSDSLDSPSGSKRGGMVSNQGPSMTSRLDAWLRSREAEKNVSGGSFAALMASCSDQILVKMNDVAAHNQGEPRATE